MFKFLLIFISFTVLTFANYSKAVQYYNAGQYQKVITEAKASKKSYSNPNLHLIWGFSAQSLGKLNEAMSAYERVLLLDKSNKQAQTALNKIYEKTKRYKLLNKNDPNTSSDKLNATLALSFGFDNNLDATPDSDTLKDYFGDTAETNKTSSSFTRITAFIDYTDDFTEKNAWYAKYILRAYAQNNNDANFYNLKTIALETGLGYKTETYNLYLPISYHKVNYLGKNLLNQSRFNPKLLIPIGQNKILDFNLLYSQNKYIHTEDKIKDDTTYAIEAGNYFLHDKDYISIHFKYEHHSAISGFSSKYIGANFWTLKLGAKHVLTSKLLATMQYRFRYGQYDDVVGTTVTTRDDNFHQLDTKLTYKWSDKSNLFIANTYSENKSNYPAAVYQKNTIHLGVDFSY